MPRRSCGSTPSSATSIGPRETPNLLIWHRTPWLIDHGSTLYFHHTPGWAEDLDRARATFPAIKEHVLRRWAAEVAGVDQELAARLTPAVVDEILGMVPAEWLGGADMPAEVARAAYRRYLLDRLVAPRGFAEEAARAR